MSIVFDNLSINQQTLYELVCKTLADDNPLGVGYLPEPHLTGSIDKIPITTELTDEAGGFHMLVLCQVRVVRAPGHPDKSRLRITDPPWPVTPEILERYHDFANALIENLQTAGVQLMKTGEQKLILKLRADLAKIVPLAERSRHLSGLFDKRNWRTPSALVWAVGNSIITAVTPSKGFVEVELYPYQGFSPDGSACEGWNELLEGSKRWNFATPVEPVTWQGYAGERAAKQKWFDAITLYDTHPSVYESQWKAERREEWVSLADINIETITQLVHQKWKYHLWIMSTRRVMLHLSKANVRFNAEQAADEFFHCLEISWRPPVMYDRQDMQLAATSNASNGQGAPMETARPLIHSPYNTHDTYRHLFALCQNDKLFTISDYRTDYSEGDYDRIAIGDQARMNQLGRAAGAIIGTVRLLPAGAETAIMFVDKDAFHHLPIPEGGTELFALFIRRVQSHFESLEGAAHKDIPSIVQKSVMAYMTKLRRNLAAYFTKEELHILCFDLDVDYENLGADTLDGMAMELVRYCRRTGSVSTLAEECRKRRPHVSWNDEEKE